MTWRSITQKELEICQKMVQWLEVRHEWNGEPWLPTNADISKSALFERILSGYEPLLYPPPTGMSCPWYAVVEDPGPHFAGESLEKSGWGPHFYASIRDLFINPISYSEAKIGNEVLIHQGSYKIIEVNETKHFTLKDAKHETPYRFNLWYDPEYKYVSIAKKPPQGGWMIQNIEFNNERLTQ